MKLTVINPVIGNPQDMWQKIEHLWRPLLHPDTEVEFVDLAHGFPSVECEVHAAFNGPEVALAALAAWKRGSDGIFVNCFDDPGVPACRELLPIPVLGGYQAAIGMARLLADRCAVISTDLSGVLSEGRKAQSHDFHPVAIRSVDMGVLDLGADQETLLDRLEPVCRELWEKDLVGAIALGCTCMSPVVPALQERLRKAGCPTTVVDPFLTGLTQVEHMARLGYSNHMPGAALALDRLAWYEEI